VLLQAVDLEFGYGRRGPGAGGLVIAGVSLDVHAGALVGILGPNGSGKTTLLRLLAGTLAPSRGQVRLDGRDLPHIPRALLARRFAVVPQETQLAFEYTALEIALMGRYPHLGAFELERPIDLASAFAALEATGTRHLADRMFQTLSGGEKQRVVIAAALAQLDEGLHATDDRPSALAGAAAPGPRPAAKLLFLDEPTASLDLRYQIEVAQLIRQLHDRQAVSIVLSTHDVHFARAVCADVVLLREGRVLARGLAADVLTPARLGELYDIDVSSPLAGALV
jgi:iron complex transport system ATP-binding protein